MSVRIRDDPQRPNLNSASACFESEDHFKVIGGGAAGASHENGGWSIGANATRFVLALGLLVGLCASAHAATVCVTPNRDMSSSVTAKARPRVSSFRRPATTTPPATTIRPNLAAPDLRRPQRIRCSAPWFCVELRRSARSLNLGTSCADTTLLGNLRDPVPKPTPPSDHIPLRRRCAFWCLAVSTRQWPNLVFGVA
jgi:hypothetical protein